MAIIDFEVDDHIAVVTINRPEARNAVNDEVARGIETAVDRLEEDDALWIGVLTGVPPVFCAGADLKMINAGRAAELSTERGGFAGYLKRDRMKPIIAAVDGPALAGGTEITLASDLVVASVTATFGIPEVKRSRVAGGGGLFRLPRKIPFNIAMEMVLTGEPVTAQRAYQLGLVNYVTEPGGALARAKELAKAIEANAPLAVRASRRVVLAAATEAEDVGWRLSNDAHLEVDNSEDSKEGLVAFIEKRPAAWKGR